MKNRNSSVGESMVIQMEPDGTFLEDGIPAEIAHA